MLADLSQGKLTKAGIDFEQKEDLMSTLGSGHVEYTEGRKIIHFGSPAEDVYAPVEPDNSNVKRNISVKEWLENER